MSKAVKRKVSVELQKPSSKSRLSVFQRLGTKKSKSLSDSKSLTDETFKQTLSAAVSITTKPILSKPKPDAVELEDADPDILEKKREEIRKELELQMKMESRRIAARKRKHAESSSSSSTSGSDSDSSSSTSSSSSSDNRHKARKLKSKRRDSSSSSDEYAKKLAKKKRSCQSKKEALKLHKMSKKHEISVSRKSKKRSPSPLAKKHRGDSSSIMLSPSGQKVMVKNLKISTSVDKHHRMREKDVERSELMQRSERERLRLRERDERIRSRSPKMAQTISRTPKRERSPLLRRSPSDKRNRSLSRRMETDDRREKERELAREKERRDALLRCQERQRERERLSTKDSKGQRLLPRPAERVSMIAAAQERSTDKDTYSSRSFADRSDSFEHRRHEKEPREHDRSYEKYESHTRRETTEYAHSSSYRRDWHEETSSKDMYERSTEHQSSSREWDHKRNENVRASEYSDRKEWTESTPKWADSRKPAEKYERRGQSDYAPHGSGRYADRSESFDPGSTSSVSKPIGGGGIRGRWSTWRGRGRGSHHHTDFRRPHHHTEILEERGEIYRRHINPQGANTNKPATITKPSDAQPTTPTEKTSEDLSKSLAADENPDGEEIADDLSEISDEADDILGQQEETSSKAQAFESVADKSIAEDSKDIVAQAVKDSNEVEIEKSIEPNENTDAQEKLTPAKSPEEPDRSKDLSDDIDLDFEEISDGELEEEARTKGLGDALGVDWASLVEESKAMMRERLTKVETSARQRWNPNQILLDVGISYRMAGTVFAQQTLISAHESMKHELNTLITVKTEPLDDSNHMDVDVKIEKDIEHDIIEPIVNGKCEIDDRKLILHPLPCVQTSVENSAEKQRQLVFNASGPYSRGLSTRRDIEMRRQLCNLAINESNCKTIMNNRTGYENVALKLFQKALQA